MSTPAYVLAASISAGNRIRGFLTESAESPKHLLERPPTFRWAGFDTTTGDQARLVADDAYEVRSSDRKLLRLYQDGTLLFRMAADAVFLGWGQDEEDFAREPRLNPVAVVEAHASFVHLYRAVLPMLVKTPTSVQFALRLEDAQVGTRRLVLTRYYKGGIRRVVDPQEYPAHSVSSEDTLDVPTDAVVSQPDLVAFKLLERFYDMFDMPPDLIPFAREDGDTWAVDLEQIKAL